MSQTPKSSPLWGLRPPDFPKIPSDIVLPDFSDFDPLKDSLLLKSFLSLYDISLSPAFPLTFVASPSPQFFPTFFLLHLPQEYRWSQGSPLGLFHILPQSLFVGLLTCSMASDMPAALKFPKPPPGSQTPISRYPLEVWMLQEYQVLCWNLTISWKMWSSSDVPIPLGQTKNLDTTNERASSPSSPTPNRLYLHSP